MSTRTVSTDRRVWICACCHDCAEDDSMPFDVSPPVKCGTCGAYCSCQGCRAEAPQEDDADGQILAEADGYVVAVQFKDKRNKYGDVESTERAHTIKVD